ncbi:MAG: DUF488 domain-containing protein [Gammaproteobacteria bacterium]|nr:DUF488 domain-containing protein [Gammaproteobacteria bacterium]
MTETIYTIGHSTRPIEEFIALLREHGIEVLVDIRTVPKSRRNPQFGQQSLAESLDAAGIEYRYMKSLGGLRRPSKDSINTGWRNESFRGYADHMQTEEFQLAVEELVETGAKRRAAIMCAEAVPWRCHRSLVGDALLVRGVDVVDVMGPKASRPRKLTPFARVDGARVTYPPE